jgi:hypothetical protein
MRLWSLHPKYLDRQGLLALWREGLLAQKVLSGHTKGYKNHPQLIRFKNHKSPLGAMGYYLLHVLKEGVKRGYKFDRTKINKHCAGKINRIVVHSGQIAYERKHLFAKLKRRDAQKYQSLKKISKLHPHPFFEIVKGGIAGWEKSKV